MKQFAVGIIAVLFVAMPSLSTFASLVTTDIFIVSEQQPLSEDVYVTSLSGKVDGVIDGDLTIFTGNLTISGQVTGSVTVFSSGSVVVEPTGSINGSLRGAAANVTVRGSVGGDLFISAASIVVEDFGTVERDAILFGGTARINGSVGRDVRGRTLRLVVDGSVGGDLDVATLKLEVGPTAEIDKDILYRSSVEADVASTAVVGGTITRLPTQSNFVYGTMIALANVISFLGFLVAGLIVLWALRRTSSRAVGIVLTRPVRSLLVGVLTVVVLPFVVVILAITLVGLPLAGIGLLIGAGFFIIGPVPAVTALGNRVLLRRGGLFGAFVAGAVLWRFGIWIVPVVGAFVYVLAMVWGVGAWVLAALATRRGDPIPAALLPQSLIVEPQAPVDWEAPLAPGRVAIAADDVAASIDALEDDSIPVEADENPSSEELADESIQFSDPSGKVTEIESPDITAPDADEDRIGDVSPEDEISDPEDPTPDSWGLRS